MLQTKTKKVSKGIENKTHQCKSCGKLFVNLGCLKNHIHIVHEGRKNHKCDFCGKSFTQAIHLQNHIHHFHGGCWKEACCKDHKCDTCGKSFHNANDL